MRILVLSPRQCWPPVTGAKQREYYLLRSLGCKAHVTHLSFSEPGSPPLVAEDLPFCREVITVPRPRRYTAGKLLRGLMQAPLPVINYLAPPMRSALAELLERQRFDLVHIEGIQMMGYLPLLRPLAPPTGLVCDWHNIESELMRRYGASVPSLPKKMYARFTARGLEAIESRILHGFLGHVVCSERERRELLRTAPQARIAVIGNGVDVSNFAHAGAADLAARRRILFVGSMDYYPNIEAALHFGRRVWPRIRARFPDLRFTVVGTNPTPPVLSLREHAGIEVTGMVPDVKPYYAEALAAVAPLRTGGGTRLKILEAMAAGTPVISTTLGAEGLAVTPDRDILIADDDPQWENRISGLLHNKEWGGNIAAAARELVLQRYDWKVLGDTLAETYAEWTETNPSAPPSPGSSC